MTQLTYAKLCAPACLLPLPFCLLPMINTPWLNRTRCSHSKAMTIHSLDYGCKRDLLHTWIYLSQQCNVHLYLILRNECLKHY